MISLSDESGSLYERLYRSLLGAIQDGRLSPGQRLPGSRALARDLGVSRVVVVTAYEMLAAQSYVVSSVGSGTVVATRGRTAQRTVEKRTKSALASPPSISAHARRACKLAPEPAPPAAKTSDVEIADFRFTNPAPDGRTLLLWRQSLARASGAADVDYPDPSGHAPLRQALASNLREQRGVIADADDILIVNGSQQALDLTARVLADRGVKIGIEEPQYVGIRDTLLVAGAKLVPCPVDDRGLDVDRHDAALRDVRALYITPSRQFPTGAVMDAARRKRLLAWCARRDVWVVEDDYDCEFRHGVGQLPALQGHDEADRVIYIGGFARTLFPGLRLGYLVLPTRLRSAFHAVKRLSDRGSSPVEQRALAGFIKSGGYESARRRVARRMDEKGRKLLAALQSYFAASDIDVWGSSPGLHHFVRLPALAPSAVDAFIAYAQRRGVQVYSGAHYHLRKPPHATLVLGHARVTSDAIDAGARALARAYRTFNKRKG